MYEVIRVARGENGVYVRRILGIQTTKCPIIVNILMFIKVHSNNFVECLDNDKTNKIYDVPELFALKKK